MGINFDFENFKFEDFDSLDSGIDANDELSDTPDVADIVTDLRKRVMVVVMVIDISPSMKGAKMGSVNDALRNVINELRRREHGSTAAEIRIALITFATRAEAVTKSPVPVSEYSLKDIQPVQSGCTSYSSAFFLLNEKLSSKEFMKSAAGAYTPLVVLMTDGKPSDPGLYEDAIRELEENKWFKYSTRAAIAIGKEANNPECKKALIEFTKDKNNVFESRNAVMLAKQIELVTLTGVDFATKQGSIQNTAVSPQIQPTVKLPEQPLTTNNKNNDEFAFEQVSPQKQSETGIFDIDLSEINSEEWTF